MPLVTVTFSSPVWAHASFFKLERMRSRIALSDGAMSSNLRALATA